ncbi:hypothetical protein PFISCL1PPCAC_28778, partial [Pristionchus fissidentatus]
GTHRPARSRVEQFLGQLDRHKKFVSFLLLALLVVIAVPFLFHFLHAEKQTFPFFPHSEDDETRIRSMVDEINNKNLSWTAEYNHQASLPEAVMEAHTADYRAIDIEGMGTAESVDHRMNVDTDNHLNELADLNLTLPSHFDARSRWSQCWSVHQIQNQGGCGSCWVAAAVSMMSDSTLYFVQLHSTINNFHPRPSVLL